MGRGVSRSIIDTGLAMEHAILGKTGLSVSRIALGAAQLGDPSFAEDRVERVLNCALDLGINFIDTAAMYAMSEQRIGRYLAHRKSDFRIATKCGAYWDETAGERRLVEDYSPRGIASTVERSRQKLKLDVLDLVQFHDLPPVDGLEASFDALLGLKEKGYADFVGVSADGPAAAAFVGKPTEGRNAADIARQWPVDTWQFTYNFLSPEAAEELIPTLRAQNIGAIVKRPISNVVWDIREEPEDDFYRKPWQRARQLPLRTLAGDLPMVEFALRFALSHPGADTLLVGTVNEEHLAANVRLAAGGPLPEQMLRRTQREFEKRFARPRPRGGAT